MPLARQHVVATLHRRCPEHADCLLSVELGGAEDDRPAVKAPGAISEWLGEYPEASPKVITHRPIEPNPDEPAQAPPPVSSYGARLMREGFTSLADGLSAALQEQRDINTALAAGVGELNRKMDVLVAACKWRTYWFQFWRPRRPEVG